MRRERERRDHVPLSEALVALHGSPPCRQWLLYSIRSDHHQLAGHLAWSLPFSSVNSINLVLFLLFSWLLGAETSSVRRWFGVPLLLGHCLS